MKNLEKEMEDIARTMEKLEPPKDFEQRLRKKLHEEPSRAQKQIGQLWAKRYRVAAAILLIAILLGTFRYDILAYYGKKILGYDEIIYRSMKELNETGFGQEISQSYTFRNGTQVLLDGAMLDKNKLLVMYRVRGTKESIMRLSVRPLKGWFGTYSYKGGHGKVNEEFTEVKNVCEFESPFVLDNHLKFSVLSLSEDESQGEVGTMGFKLNYEKCIKRIIELNLDKSVEHEGIRYNFNRLSATQMSTELEGTAELVAAADKNQSGYSLGALSSHLQIQLLATYEKKGERITEIVEGGIRSQGSRGDGMKNFTYEYQGLKPNVKKLTLSISSVVEMKEIDVSIPLRVGIEPQSIAAESKELLISSVKRIDGNTVVSVHTRKDAEAIVGLLIEGEQATQLNSEILEDKEKDSVMEEHVYTFWGSGQNMTLIIKGVRYVRDIGKQFVIYE